MSSDKFQGHTGQKIANFDPDWAFPDWNSSLNSLMAMKWRTKLEVAYKRCLIGFQWHPGNFKITRGKKNADFDPNWAFPGCKSSLNSPMVMKLFTKLEVATKRCLSVFQGNLTNFKVTRDKKLLIFDPNRTFLDCNLSLNSLMDTKWCTKLEVA